MHKVQGNAPRGWISPHYDSSKVIGGKVDDIIDVYEDCVKGWIIAPAKYLLEAGYDTVPILTILLPYFETHAVYYQGRDSDKHSEQFFRMAFQQVCGEISSPPGSNPEWSQDILREFLVSKLYRDARCGLVHNTAIGEGILIGTTYGFINAGLFDAKDPRWKTKSPLAVTKVDKLTGKPLFTCVCIDMLLGTVEKHFYNYLSELRVKRDSNLRTAFVRGWNIINPSMKVLSSS